MREGKSMNESWVTLCFFNTVRAWKQKNWWMFYGAFFFFVFGRRER
jgi:hypothetical protein